MAKYITLAKESRNKPQKTPQETATKPTHNYLKFNAQKTPYPPLLNSILTSTEINNHLLRIRISTEYPYNFISHDVISKIAPQIPVNHTPIRKILTPKPYKIIGEVTLPTTITKVYTLIKITQPILYLVVENAENLIHLGLPYLQITNTLPAITL